MNLELNGLTALVTGASRGIGWFPLATARAVNAAHLRAGVAFVDSLQISGRVVSPSERSSSRA